MEMETPMMAAAAAPPPPAPPPTTTTPTPAATPPMFTNSPLDEGFQAGRKPRKEYKCHACDKVFKRSEHFTRHVRVHTKERPFGCRFCPKTYGRKDLVRRHEKTLHAELAERADEERARNGAARQSNARRDSELLHHQQLPPQHHMQSPPGYSHGSSYPSAEQPYPMHHAPSQDGHLYSPVSHQSGGYDHQAEPLPHSDPSAQGEPLMIDPMLEEAFSGHKFPANDQYGGSADRHYPQGSSYYPPAEASAASIPVDPDLDFGGGNSDVKANLSPTQQHHGPPTHALSVNEPAYGQYSGYEPQPYDYR